jgi:succinate dehydrogenase/fumarate reductase flavoprotein subunit
VIGAGAAGLMAAIFAAAPSAPASESSHTHAPPLHVPCTASTGAPGGLNLRIDGLYLTQSVQSYSGNTVVWRHIRIKTA